MSATYRAACDVIMRVYYYYYIIIVVYDFLRIYTVRRERIIILYTKAELAPTRGRIILQNSFKFIRIRTYYTTYAGTTHTMCIRTAAQVGR